MIAIKSRLGLGLAVCLAIAVPLTAAAQFAKKDDAIKYRQSALSLMGAHMKRIEAMVKGETPFNAAEVQKNAALIATLSELPWAGFGPGTEGGKAKPEIWKESAKFKEGSEKLMKAAVALNTAAKSGNLDQIKKAFGDTGASCKGCHDNYRDK